MASRAEYSPISRQSMSGDRDMAAQSLLSEEEKDFSFNQHRRFHQRYHLACKATLILLLLASAVVLLAGWLASVFSSSEDSAVVACEVPALDREYTFEGIKKALWKDPTAEFLMIDPCGSTPAEARVRGCRYGMLYGSWLPDECWDDESETRFKNAGHWKFWLQPNRTEELSWDEVAKGEHEYVLVEWEYHQRHCADMNRRLFTAMSRRGLQTIDSYLSQWGHFHHCQNSLMTQKPMHELSAILWRKFPDCGVIRWKN
ncbi:hypothetical protein B0H66DRAFT_252085 [Apodospora peruviana]|uniref:Uncharacterized protein n=1 Tax=Apodospora peruviana TaxID=516989 RepID=A0AAE0I5K3_9PEZI|nr:hypothetical protein B0H66DRAFT_252085 [Apodospora peruviana]